MLLRFSSFAVIAVALLPAGCYVEPGPPPAADPQPAYAAPAAEPVVVEAPPAPPPPPPEAVPVSPGPEYFYIVGYHRWNRGRYEWVRGHYERRPRPEARYAPAHWERRGRGQVWVEGHWN